MNYRSDLKRLQALRNKKFRKEYGQFFIEGEKIILEALESDFRIIHIWLNAESNSKIRQKAVEKGIEVREVSRSWLERAGNLKTNNVGVALLDIPDTHLSQSLESNWILLLDRINDPGNLGTIIRSADWFGIQTIICSPDSVDLYNPKTLMSSKGSFLRVNVLYEEIERILKNDNREVLAADMNGEDIHELKSFPSKGYLLMGSESHGISPVLEQFISKRIHISGKGGAESLNVSISTAIILDNLFRMKAI
jgi:TrmH family RNA methyltransferase